MSLPVGKYRTDAGSTLEVSGKHGGISTVEFEWLEEPGACMDCHASAYDDEGYLVWHCDLHDGGRAKWHRIESRAEPNYPLRTMIAVVQGDGPPTACPACHGFGQFATTDHRKDCPYGHDGDTPLELVCYGSASEPTADCGCANVANRCQACKGKGTVLSEAKALAQP